MTPTPMTSYTVINPATEQPVTQIEHTTAEQTDAAIERAARAQESWRNVGAERPGQATAPVRRAGRRSLR